MSKVIKMTNLALTHGELGFIALLSQVKSLKAPGNVQWNVVRTLRNLSGPNEDFWSVRNSVFEKWCKKDEKGKAVITEKQEYDFASDEDRASCLKEIADLTNAEVELEIYPIKGSDVEKIADITGDQIIGLGEFIEDENAPKKKETKKETKAEKKEELEVVN
jgi:hypothetical protein